MIVSQFYLPERSSVVRSLDEVVVPPECDFLVLVIGGTFISEASFKRWVTGLNCVVKTFDYRYEGESSTLNEVLPHEARECFVLAIGGGSAVDAAKTLVAIMRRKFGSCRFWCVVSSPGSGAETSRARVYRDADREKKSEVSDEFVPNAVFYLESAIRSLPTTQIVDGLFDALAHMLESRNSIMVSEFADLAASGGLKVWQRAALGVEDGYPLSAGACRALCVASWAGGAAQSFGGTSVVHALAHAVESLGGFRHGRVVRMLLPGFLEFYREIFSESHTRDDFHLVSVTASRISEAHRGCEIEEITKFVSDNVEDIIALAQRDVCWKLSRKRPSAQNLGVALRSFV